MTFIESLIARQVAETSPARQVRRGRRISLQNAVVAVALFDSLFLILSCFLPTLVYIVIVAQHRMTGAEALYAGGVAELLFLICCRAAGTYETQKIVDFRFGFVRHILCVFIVFSLMLFLAGVLKAEGDYSRFWFFSWMLMVLVVPNLFRWAVTRRLQRRLEAGDFVLKAMSISLFGEPLSAKEIHNNGGHLVTVVETRTVDHVAELSALADVIARNEIDQIYVKTRWEDAPLALTTLRELRQLAAEIIVVPHNDRMDNLILDVSRLGDRAALSAVRRPIDDWGLWLKRMQDICVASVALLIFAPVMLLVALAISIESPGPILFRQKRLGFNGRTFELLKFRSMYQSMSDANASVQTSRNDRRVTRIGRIIRKTSIDEFPQFLNVLLGSMSVVGPRPHALDTRAEGTLISEVTDQYAARHRVKPGLTGLAQVSGYRGELDSADKVCRRVEHDIAYIENWSTWLDIKIILKTAMLLFYDPHAY